MNHKAFKIITLLFDIGIVGLVIASAIWMLTSQEAKNAGPWEFMKYYTVQSNFFMGLIALVFIPFDIFVLLGFKNEVPHWLKTVGLLGTVGVVLTMLTVIFFLGPTVGFGMMYSTYNLLMHLITPLVALIRFLFYGTENPKLKIYDSIIGISTMAAYGTFYIINVISHDGYGKTQYDWYGFGKGGPFIGILAFLAMLLATFVISFLLYFGQKKIAGLRSKRNASEKQ